PMPVPSLPGVPASHVPGSATQRLTPPVGGLPFVPVAPVGPQMPSITTQMVPFARPDEGVPELSQLPGAATQIFAPAVDEFVPVPAAPGAAQFPFATRQMVPFASGPLLVPSAGWVRVQFPSTTTQTVPFVSVGDGVPDRSQLPGAATQR